MSSALTDRPAGLGARIWRRIRYPGWIRVEIAILVGVLVLVT